MGENSRKCREGESNFIQLRRAGEETARGTPGLQLSLAGEQQGRAREQVLESGEPGRICSAASSGGMAASAIWTSCPPSNLHCVLRPCSARMAVDHTGGMEREAQLPVGQVHHEDETLNATSNPVAQATGCWRARCPCLTTQGDGRTVPRRVCH